MEKLVLDSSSRQQSRDMRRKTDEANRLIKVSNPRPDVDDRTRQQRDAALATLSSSMMTVPGRRPLTLRIVWDGSSEVWTAVEALGLRRLVSSVDVIADVDRFVEYNSIPCDMSFLADDNWTAVRSVSVRSVRWSGAPVTASAALERVTHLHVEKSELGGAFADLASWPALDTLILEDCRTVPTNVSRQCLWSPGFPLALPTHAGLRTLRIELLNLPERVDLGGCAGLEEVDIGSCRGLKTLVMPPSASGVVLSNCLDLERVEGLDRGDSSLESLDVFNCGRLRTGLERITAPLVGLSVADCRSIVTIVVLSTERLEAVEVSDCSRLALLGIIGSECGMLESHCVVSCDSLAELCLGRMCPQLCILQAQTGKSLKTFRLPDVCPELEEVDVDREDVPKGRGDGAAALRISLTFPPSAI